MSRVKKLHQWKERLRDRARTVSFGRFLWRRFLDDRLFQAAASLAYTTVFALVPLAIVVFGVLSAFPAFNEWKDALTDFIFTNFVPGAARSVQNYLNRSLEDLGKFTVAGMVALVASLLITLHSIEQTFNSIWRVAAARPKVTRFLIYWTVLTLGTMLAAASMAMAAYVFALPLFRTTEGQWLAEFAWRLAPMAVEFICIVLIYRVVPQHVVRLRHALPGALLAVILMEIVKWGFGVYLGNFQTYQRIYGALSALPILLLWIYLSWVSVLLGASLASSMAAFRYQPEAMRLPTGFEIYGRFRQARIHGEGLDEDRILALEPMLTDTLMQELLCELKRMRLLRRDERGQWLLARDLDLVPLAELYENCQLRVPIEDRPLPCRDDAYGQAAAAALEQLRQPLRSVLAQPVGDLYTHLPGDPP
ncbi:YihY family inner membrane protein [Xanthomonas oryzae]|uniref:YihY family inner membrane protein n=1 Tax=Xanthomonas oryzae TaxID=347 RepID=UPI000949C61B|nr:YihY family inner membrane protein [Xanthomonas oryzae]OLK10101.1 ribonuclease BN [Xanthomonas oryzae pv. oryzae]UXV91313.1 YihY family inner membrane protein [Xanthomonas oryzae pv. oryzae]